jgi:putative ABC transport system ATP-binding protein
MEILRETAVHPDRAVVVVTHDNRVFHFGDRIVHMSDGRIEQIETARSSTGSEAPSHA